MLETLRGYLKDGPLETTIVAVGANVQLTLKVAIYEADEVGIACKVKGMLGGYSELQLRPWPSIITVALPG